MNGLREAVEQAESGALLVNRAAYSADAVNVGAVAVAALLRARDEAVCMAVDWGAYETRPIVPALIRAPHPVVWLEGPTPDGQRVGVVVFDDGAALAAVCLARRPPWSACLVFRWVRAEDRLESMTNDPEAEWMFRQLAEALMAVNRWPRAFFQESTARVPS